MEPGTLKRAREYNGREEDTQGMRCAFCQKRGGSWTQGYYPGLHGDACSAIVGLQDDLEKESMRGSTEFYRLDNGSKFGLGSLAWLSDVNDFIGPWNVPDRGDVYIHQSCAVWSPQIYSDPKTNELLNVRLEIQRSLYIRCSHCRLSGASIGCHNTNCSRSFHLPCAKEASCFMDYENYRLLCVKCMNQAFDQRYYDLWNVLRQKKKREFSQLEKYEILKGFRPVDAKILAESALLTSASASSESSAFHFGASLPLPGLEFVYLQLKESVVIPLLYPVLYSRLNVKPFRGVLLHGPSGCGKTSIVREFAKFCQSFKDKKISSITFLHRSGADVLSRYHGETEKNLRDLFENARQNQPAVIFFDEIDALAPVRSSKQNQVHSSIVSTLLSLMDGLNDLGSIFVIGATTRVEAVDPALRRPGRFDKEIYIGLPNFRARTQILRQIIDCWGRGFLSDSDLFSISEKCNGFSPADIKALCSEAVLHAIRRNYPELVDSPSKEELIEFDPESVSIHVMDLQFGYDKLKSRIQSQSAMSRHSPVPLPESAPANLLVAYQNALQHFSLKDISEDLRAEEMKAFPQLELLVRSPCIYLMIHGDGNIGQEEVALALLDRLDVPVVVCDFECLLLGHSSLGIASEWCIKIRKFQETPNGILYLPRFELLWQHGDQYLRHVVETSLHDIRWAQKSYPVRVLLTSHQRWNTVNAFRLKIPPSIHRIFSENSLYIEPAR